MREIITKMNLWERELAVKFVFSAGADETIDPQEQQLYEDFLQNADRYGKQSLAAVKAYIHANERDVLEHADLPAIPRDVFKILKIEAIRFYPQGTLAIFCDTKWDSHGLALYYENGQWDAMTPDMLWLRT